MLALTWTSPPNGVSVRQAGRMRSQRGGLIA
jgi:hypothetical protein